jgi:hypothetical protein
LNVSRAFVNAFARVHAAFCTLPAEIEEAKAAARANMVAAEDSYYASSAMLDAGWDPMAEQAWEFRKRTRFTPEQRWPITPREKDIVWPSLSLQEAA